jgi:hypothetical protein
MKQKENQVLILMTVAFYGRALTAFVALVLM